MQIQIFMDGENRIFDFSIKKIIQKFHSQEKKTTQTAYVEEKLKELSIIDGIHRKRINIISKIKRFYLIQIRHLDLILNGLLKMSQES